MAIGSSSFSSKDFAQGVSSGALQLANPKGVYWVGRDGNVWVAGNQGTNSAGRYDAISDTYWINQGFNRISDPNTGVTLGEKTTTPGGGSSAPAYDPADLAWLDSQIGRTHHFGVDYQ